MSEPFERLKQAREGAGYDSAADFARTHNLPEGTYRSHENGMRGITRTTAARYGRLLNVTASWLLYGESETKNSISLPLVKEGSHTGVHSGQKINLKPKRFIPIIGVLQAGMFREEADTDEPEGYVQDYADARYQGMDRYAKRVAGPSMNNVIKEGSIAILVSFMSLGRDPESGEIVEVVRRGADGLIETTLKRYVEIDGAKYLEPDSSHPDFRQPIKLHDNGEEDSVTVRGLLIRAIVDF